MDIRFHYKPRFVDIRVRPPVAEGEAAEDVIAPGERACDHPGCRLAARSRAPKSRDLLGEHYWFCQGHASEYNRSWNFFAGMSEEEMRASISDDLATGGRPTWSFKAGPGAREAAAGRGFFRDAFGLFGGRGAPAAAAERSLGRLERQALADLELEPGADKSAIRTRYAELVKRCHPDANGGDRSAETRLQRVIRAYKVLRKAKLA
ncbi:MAG TPA: J domain-containing protein [Caulobacteraceae bacterium]|jgi:DnaJ-domain-containing protein 1|nr:J domain-containing protein [Caulobacteraceae bacterium]